MPKTKTLTQRQLSFVNLMATGTLSATQAYIKAGYSPKSAHVESSVALAKPRIQKAIEARKQQIAKAKKITPEDIARKLWELTDTADTSAAKVSALRTLADIHGLLGGGKQDLTEPVRALLEGIKAGHSMALEAGKQQEVGKRTKLNAKEVEVEARMLEDSDAEGSGTS